MNKKDELFNEFDIDLETADKIAKEYPSLSDSAKERMFNMTKKKMNANNNTNETNTNNNSVHGVEKYNRPRWIKFAGIAAAVAIIAGGIAGESYLLGNMKKSAPSSVITSEPGAAVTSETGTTTGVTTTAEDAETTTTTAAETTSENVEATTSVTDVKISAAGDAAHKLTDNYWDYECFFDVAARVMADYEGADSIKLNCAMQYGTMTSDMELVYCRTTDERLSNKTMDGLKELYNTYFGSNYDPFYSPNAEYTNNYALFGPSYTADTLPADGRIDRAYTYIEYEGKLYQKCSFKDYVFDNHWSDDQMDITDVTENSFTLRRRFNNNANLMYEEMHGTATFSVVFDEEAQDWRIEQKEVEYDYQDYTGTNESGLTD